MPVQETEETQVRSLRWEDPLELEWLTHSAVLPRKSRGKRSLGGHRPQGCKESDTAEHAHTNSLMHFDEAFADLAHSQLVDLGWNCKYK